MNSRKYKMLKKLMGDKPYEQRREFDMSKKYIISGLHKRDPTLYNYPHNNDRPGKIKRHHLRRKIRHLLPRGDAGLRLCMLHRHCSIIASFFWEE